jgi:hypothetical protein
LDGGINTIIAGDRTAASSKSARTFRPADPFLRPDPFEDDRFIFQLKHDGFRADADVTSDVCKLGSRQRNTYKRFGSLRESLASIGR